MYSSLVLHCSVVKKDGFCTIQLFLAYRFDCGFELHILVNNTAREMKLSSVSTHVDQAQYQ